MEDFFQIIIIIFFMLSSIASSMKKKKKKQQHEKKPMPRPADSKPQVKAQKQKTSAEILEEILGLKVEMPEPPTKEAPVILEENENIDTWNPSSEYDNNFEYNKHDDRNLDYEESVLSKKLEFSQDRDKRKTFVDEEITISKTKDKTVAQKLFSDRDNLKDYIIIQEILNKPKALRR